MSGSRDFKLFLASHKAQIGQNDSKLVTRLLVGHKPAYKSIDYDQLATLTQIKRSAGEKSRKKVEKLLQSNKERKESSILQEHKRVWITEWEKLVTLEEKTYREIELQRPKTPDFNDVTPPVEELYEEIIDYEDFLHFDLKEFEKNTVQPIEDLIEDVKIWTQSYENKKLVLGMRNERKEKDIRDIIDTVKLQQDKIIEQLQWNQVELERELQELMDDNHLHFVEMKLPIIETVLPDRLLNLRCPDDELRTECFNEFHELNERYSKMLLELEEKYDDVIRKVSWNWSEDDHIRFLHIINQYASVTRNRRKLVMDRMKREMPEKLKEEVNEYEQWWYRHKTFQSHLRGICHAWKRDQDDLKLHIEATFADACEEFNKQQKNKLEKMKLKFYCNFLHDKLREYKNQKDELMKLELANRIREDKLNEEKKYQKECREHQRREKEKDKILDYKEKKLRQSAIKREKEHVRMLALQEDLSIQRAHNMERIKFREEKYLEKIEKLRHQREVENRQQIEKQERLQKLADTVQVHVENDPMRVLESTQAMRHRTAAINYDDEKELQQPLFDVYTFNVEQVANDKRVTIENALRRANLHMSEYARELISKQPPPTCPRKDTLSSIFK